MRALARVAILTLLQVNLGCSSPAKRVELSVGSNATANLVVERGALPYAAQLIDGSGSANAVRKVPGLIQIRPTADLRALGGPYYDDRFGNLVRVGSFDATTHGGPGTYALTFFHDGVVQFAIDLGSDGVVDLVADRLPDGSLGLMFDPALQALIDCLGAISSEDPNFIEAVNVCLGKAGLIGGSGSGGGVGLGAGAAADYQRFGQEPDCKGSGGQGGVPDRIAEGGWYYKTKSSIYGQDGEEIGWLKVSWRANSEGTYDLRHELLYRSSWGDDTTSTYQKDVYAWVDGHRTHTQTVDHRQATPEGDVLVTRVVRRDGSVVSRSTWRVDSETGEAECTGGDCMGTDEMPPEDPDDGQSGETPTSPGQPGPDCELAGDCPREDPRCAPPSNSAEAFWDCVARGVSPLECIRLIQDALYAETGCEQVAGPADQLVVKCPPSSSAFSDCLAEGRDPLDCMLDLLGVEWDEDPAGGENDYVRPPGAQGVASVSFLESTPVGALLFSLCAADGPNCPPLIGAFHQHAREPTR